MGETATRTYVAHMAEEQRKRRIRRIVLAILVSMAGFLGYGGARHHYATAPTFDDMEAILDGIELPPGTSLVDERHQEPNWFNSNSYVSRSYLVPDDIGCDDFPLLEGRARNRLGSVACDGSTHVEPLAGTPLLERLINGERTYRLSFSLVDDRLQISLVK